MMDQLNSTMSVAEQSVALEAVLNDSSLFFTVLPVLQPFYFDAPFNSILQFVLDFYAEYKALPDVKIINSKFGSNFVYTAPTQPHEFKFFCDMIEKHCQLRAFVKLFEQNADAYHAGTIDINSVWRQFQDLNAISIQRDIGLEQFKDPEERLKRMNQRIDPHSTGWPKMDAMTDGLRRGELLIVAASTSGGKSLFLANLAYNLSLQGLDGIIVSLELNQDLIGKRLDSIITGIEQKAVFENIPAIVAEYQRLQGTVGSIITKKLRTGATANHVRNYILEYYMKFKKYPDYCCLDYLDLMSPLQRYRNDGAFDRDKMTTEEIRDVIDEFNMFGITASQLNRDAVDVVVPNISHVAGGLSKVNTSDITIAIVNASEDENVDTGERAIHLLKIRNGKKHPAPFSLWLDDSLRLREEGQRIILPKHTNVFQREKNDLTATLKEKLSQGKQ